MSNRRREPTPPHHHYAGYTENFCKGVLHQVVEGVAGAGRPCTRASCELSLFVRIVDPCPACIQDDEFAYAYRCERCESVTVTRSREETHIPCYRCSGRAWLIRRPHVAG